MVCQKMVHPTKNKKIFLKKSFRKKRKILGNRFHYWQTKDEQKTARILLKESL
jgi:hypothetical protein